jgi:hypothetical protein
MPIRAIPDADCAYQLSRTKRQAEAFPPRDP